MKVVLVLLGLVIVGLGLTTLNFRQHARTATASADSLRFVDSTLKTRNIALAAALDTQVTAASRQKEAELNRLRSTYDQLVDSMKDEISQGQIQITRLADRLSVSMVDKILFPSGEASITTTGLRILQRVGAVLKTTEGKIIRVEGHTDNVAISDKLKNTFATNWELSTARATNVVRFLQDSVGIDPDRLQAVGLSQYHPVAPNTTVQGRSQNRRIEIALLPMEPTGEP
ncbi:MAG TPA: OmpA family protein [Gemmatimonadales bacterium]|nr:OmpA family protein [Gemmatimonadales bacterium]